MVPRAVAFTIVWPEGVIFGSIMTYHVQFLLLVRQPLFDRAALPLTQTSWVLPPSSVGKMTLRLYSALNYSHGLSKGPSFGTGRARRRALVGTEKPLFHKGNQIGNVPVFSDPLLMFLLKAKRPEVYRDRGLPARAAPPDASGSSSDAGLLTRISSATLEKALAEINDT